MVPNAQGWLLGHPAPSGQMQGTWSACLGTENHVPGLTYHQASHHPMDTPLHPGLAPLGNKKAITYIPARPGLSSLKRFACTGILLAYFAMIVTRLAT